MKGKLCARQQGPSSLWW